MIIRTIYILLFILTYQFSYSQACGGGKIIFEFYTKDNDNLQYEINQIEIKDKKLLSEDTYNGVKMDSLKMKGVIEFEFDKNKLPKFISKSISCSNTIKNNELIFNTLELFNNLYLLKVWNKKSEIQILVNLFGGCNRKNIIVMSENPKLIKNTR